MPKFAPVVPPQILEKFKEFGVLGDYHLLLAHDIARYPTIYGNIFRRSAWSTMEIILDNSVVELGSAVNIDMIVKAAIAVQPTTTVLPDVMLDTEKTIVNCRDALPQWVDAFKIASLDPKFMIVPQGTTLNEWVRCAEAFEHQKEINYWGIARNTVEHLGTRIGLATILHAINPTRKIHLLGFSNNVLDDVDSAHQPYVFGIDSAVPIRAVSHGIPVNLSGALNHMPPRGDWWETAIFKPDHIDALLTARRWFE